MSAGASSNFAYALERLPLRLRSLTTFACSLGLFFWGPQGALKTQISVKAQIASFVLLAVFLGLLQIHLAAL